MRLGTIAGVLMLAGSLGCSRAEAPAATETAADAPAPPEPAPAPAAPQVGPRLDGVAGAAAQEAALCGLTLTGADFLAAYRREWSELARPARPHEAARAGLPPPESADFSPEERAEPRRARWRTGGGAWTYGEKLPADGEALEGWQRAVGNSIEQGSGVLVITSGVPSQRWRRMHWQPRFRRWGVYSEEEERAFLQAVAAGARSSSATRDPKGAARSECLKLRAAADSQRAKGLDGSDFERRMPDALARGFREELRQAAAADLLESPAWN